MPRGLYPIGGRIYRGYRGTRRRSDFGRAAFSLQPEFEIFICRKYLHQSFPSSPTFMSVLGSNISGDVGLRLLLCPLGSNVIIRTACCSVGVILPVYSTFKAIESKDQNEQQRWLLYWTAYGSFSLVEVFSDKLLSWFPLYYHLKFAFLVWLQLPMAEGAKQLYTNHLRPFFLKYQGRFDQVLGFVYREMVKLISAHQAEIKLVRTLIAKIMGSADRIIRGDINSVQPQYQRAIEDQPGTNTDDRDRTSCLEGIPGTAIEGFEPYVDEGGKRGSGAIDEVWCCSTSPVSLKSGQGDQGAALEAFEF
ncbi:hypothetical protein Nepgr_008316 [Nepenthes gracilis]|uniref:HVA22-like protein n=1 Tax=Nepenthes gracilis TaxID=150966 RepID=A0AAD3S8U6_NEPGR|nr:hypothetical protein Nepgr_008316 [Nepenthes gracilis]